MGIPALSIAIEPLPITTLSSTPCEALHYCFASFAPALAGPCSTYIARLARKEHNSPIDLFSKVRASFMDSKTCGLLLQQ